MRNLLFWGAATCRRFDCMLGCIICAEQGSNQVSGAHMQPERQMDSKTQEGGFEKVSCFGSAHVLADSGSMSW